MAAPFMPAILGKVLSFCSFSLLSFPPFVTPPFLQFFHGCNSQGRQEACLVHASFLFAWRGRNMGDNERGTNCMIIWTQNGPHDTVGGAIVKAINEKVGNYLKDYKNDRITIRELFERKDYGFGVSLYDPLVEGEYFVDPDLYGWDKNGFRQIYEIVTYKREL